MRQQHSATLAVALGPLARLIFADLGHFTRGACAQLNSLPNLLFLLLWLTTAAKYILFCASQQSTR